MMLKPECFQEVVLNWQAQYGRHDLPWQQHITPYKVLVSEIMLQQTQVKTVIPYFQRWLERFPNIASLAAAPEDDVMSCWQGLGYYSRARNLHKAAKYVVQELAGELPKTPAELREVPGVGPYTAGAITAFAYNKPGTIVDGNVKRLFARLFELEGNLNTGARHRELWELVERYTPKSHNRQFAQGLLDLGATICTPRQPRCQECPLQLGCKAFGNDTVNEFPQRFKKSPLPTRSGYFVLDENDAGIVLEQRPADSIWPRLWALPELQAADPKAPIIGRFKHTFSHYKLDAVVYQSAAFKTNNLTKRFAIDQLQDVGMPAPIRKYIEQHLLMPADNT